VVLSLSLCLCSFPPAAELSFRSAVARAELPELAAVRTGAGQLTDDSVVAAAQADSQERGRVVPAEPEEAAALAACFPVAQLEPGAAVLEPTPACWPTAVAELPMDDCSAVQLAAAVTAVYPAAGFQVRPDAVPPGGFQVPEPPVAEPR
jgi:hypothetical protein